MSFPTHLTDWKVGRLILLWPDKSVSTKAISRELDLGARTLRRYARRLGLGHRPIGTNTERKVAWHAVRFEPWLNLLALEPDPEQSKIRRGEPPLK